MHTFTYRQDLELTSTAIELGYTVKPGKSTADTLTFIKGNVNIWCAAYGVVHWVAAELVDNYYTNHKRYMNLIDALKDNA